MKYKTLLCSTAILLSSVMLANCSKHVATGDYDATEVGKVKKVVPGSIISMREVRLHSKPTDSLASQMTANLDSGANDNSLHRTKGYEYVIRLNNGSIISVVQADKTKFKNRQHVLVIYGDNTRVVADNGSDED